MSFLGIIAPSKWTWPYGERTHASLSSRSALRSDPVCPSLLSRKFERTKPSFTWQKNASVPWVAELDSKAANMAIASGLVFSRNRCAETRLAYNLAVFLANVGLPEPMADWSLTSLQLKLIKIGARVVRHARAITFQLAEVAVSGPMVRAILAAIKRLRSPPAATC
jgi:hypothetical protein